jgi:hypothetical protein
MPRQAIAAKVAEATRAEMSHEERSEDSVSADLGDEDEDSALGYDSSEDPNSYVYDGKLFVDITDEEVPRTGSHKLNCHNQCWTSKHSPYAVIALPMRWLFSDN